jgi:hypothetical protein
MKEIDVHKLFNDELYNKSEKAKTMTRITRKIREYAATLSMFMGIFFLLLNVISVLTSPSQEGAIIISMANIGFLLLTTVLMDKYHPASAIFLAVYVLSNTMNLVIMFVTGIPAIYNLIIFSVIVLTFVIIRRHKRI